MAAAGNSSGDVRQDWLARLPKVELHLHLEGAIPNPALWQLIEKYGGDPRVARAEDLPGYFKYRDFPEFPRIRTAFLKAGILLSGSVHARFSQHPAALLVSLY